MASKEQVVVLYVKTFEWLDSKLAEEFNGHPQEGRVYRGLKNKELNTYRLKIDEELGGDLQGLQLDILVGTFKNWICDIEELDEEKLASYDVEAEDFLKIQKWIDKKNADLRPLMEDGEDEIMMELTELVPIAGSMDTITENDPELADAITWFAAMIAGSYERPHIETSLDLHTTASEMGKGANMALSLDRIEKYLNAPDDFPPYLAQSAFYHMLEIARLNTKHQ